MSDENATYDDTLALRLRRIVEMESDALGIADTHKHAMTMAAVMPPARLKAIIETLLTAPSIVDAVPPGITKGRLAGILAPGERHLAEPLMKRLDAAGVLVEPRSEALRRREPRLFQSADVEYITARIQAVAREEP